ncbi:MAG TPA: flagellar motor protein MotB [Acetobacteraceae bacterium]|nr:flagellar motor protein MotB [Acetobacteraceae bacterium]
MSSKRGKKGDSAPQLVVKRYEESAHGAHHGGAWKIAYADFVTAMMAFFLLLWLVNATTDAQRTGLADYFAPTNFLSRGASGNGQPFAGRSLNTDGSLNADAALSPRVRVDRVANNVEEDTPDGMLGAARSGDSPNEAEADPAAELHRMTEAERRAALAAVGEEIRQAVNNDPGLSDLGKQLLVEEVPEGLRIQIVDAEGQPVFPTGLAAPNERGRALLLRAAQVIARLPHQVEVTGHTDAAPFRGGAGRSNWELSAERANAARRLLLEAGIAERRVRSVTGRAEREPLNPANPLEAGNRRVAVLVLLPNISAPNGGAAVR